MTARCPTCDQEGCRSFALRDLPVTHVKVCADDDCHAHRVDWRARALAAEAERSEIIALVSPSSDQSLPDAVRDLCAYVEELRPAAAKWAAVAPLIERLREADASFSANDSTVDAIDAILAATEATP